MRTSTYTTGFVLSMLVCAALSVSGQAPPFDVIIRGGQVLYGTGAPAVASDVGIRGGRIAAMGQLAGQAASRVIDATGLVVAPGFIDLHTHSDMPLLADALPKSIFAAADLRRCQTAQMQHSLMKVALLLGVHYIPAAIIAFIVAWMNNFMLNRYWTFRAHAEALVGQGARYLAVSVVALIANLIVLQLLVNAGLGETLSQAIAIVLVTPLSYLLSRRWSFR